MLGTLGNSELSAFAYSVQFLNWTESEILGGFEHSIFLKVVVEYRGQRNQKNSNKLEKIRKKT